MNEFGGCGLDPESGLSIENKLPVQNPVSVGGNVTSAKSIMSRFHQIIHVHICSDVRWNEDAAVTVEG